MSWCEWCDVSVCPNGEWNRGIVDSIIKECVEKMPSGSRSNNREIAKKVKEELKERELNIKWCMLCLQVNEYVEKTKNNITILTLT